jgi:GT2 family glycosyltransferase
MNSDPAAAILIVNWNGWEDTQECLASLRRHAAEGRPIVICDNGSSNDSVPRLHSWLTACADEEGLVYRRYGPQELHDQARYGGTEDLVLLELGENLGFAGANNAAMRFLEGPTRPAFFWLLNNDTIALPGALAALLTAVEREPTVGIAGSKILDFAPSHPPRLQAAGGGAVSRWTAMTRQWGRGEEDLGQWDLPLELEYATGSSLLVRATTVDEVGDMEESFFLYSEEVDWCLRARAAGWRIVYVPGSVIRHREGGSRGATHPATDYHALRSMLLLTRRRFPQYLLPVILHSLYRCVLPKIVRGQPRRLAATLAAYVDFARGRSRKWTT